MWGAVEFFQQNLITLRHADKAVLVFKTLRGVAQCKECNDAAGNQSECAEAEEVEEDGVHKRSMTEIFRSAYSCSYGNQVRENQWGYAPRENAGLHAHPVFQFISSKQRIRPTSMNVTASYGAITGGYY